MPVHHPAPAGAAAGVKVLVTGGAGFVGAHIVERLAADGAEVRVLDRVVPPDTGAAAECITGDITDHHVVDAAVDGVDAVCHQAARVGLGVDFGDAPGYVRDNDMGTATLLRAMFAASFRGRIVLASSMVVYGEGRYRCVRHGVVAPGPRRIEDLEAGRFDPPCPACGEALSPDTVGEDAPLDPRNVYAATKVHQEHLCASFARETGNTAVALRYHNVYGVGMPQDTPYAGVASIFCSALRRGEAPEVFEDGGQLRDFVHVADVARANAMALGAPADVSGGFNVASGRRRSVLDMADALASAFGPAAPRPVVTGAYRLGDVRHVVASPERARDVLGFTAAIEFEEGMAQLAAVARP